MAGMTAPRPSMRIVETGNIPPFLQILRRNWEQAMRLFDHSPPRCGIIHHMTAIEALKPAYPSGFAQLRPSPG